MDLDTSEYFLDLETGEIQETPKVNLETGEHEGKLIKRFRIPSLYHRSATKRHKKRKSRRLKADPQESQLITASIFLLPTMVLFHPLLAIVALILELFLHNWSHEKNKKLNSGDAVYFQSPLHPIVKEFCGKCKDENASVKISRLQDIKNDKLKNYIRRIVR